MRFRKKLKGFLQGAALALTLVSLAGAAVEAQASQSSFRVKTTVGDVSGAVGAVVEIPVTVSSQNALRGFSGKLSGNYDERVLEFQGMDTKELPSDGMTSVSGGNFSYLSSSGDSTFSSASYTLKFKILQASADPVKVTIQDLYYTDGSASSEKTSLTATVTVGGGSNGTASNGTDGNGDAAADGTTSNAGALSGNNAGTAAASGQNGSQITSGSNGNTAASAEVSGQQGDENADPQNDVAVTSLNPENGEEIAVDGSFDTGADDTGKMARGKGTAQSASVPVAVIVIIVLAAVVIGIVAGVKISKKRK
ncbi:MAG: cohesin domain-containing protein [Lachnospiraceae bacterium]|nr:cohesin domain-containing protein [Lachnospiraceae bacterium]